MEKLCSLYIHVPFCKAKCYYCDFNSYANCTEYIDEYFKCLKKEIKGVSNKLEGYIIKTIFIGGGTPSFVDARYIYDILGVIYAALKVKEDAEITIESNPGTLNRSKLSIFRECNINRISMGVQSTNDEILHKIGRIHTYKEFVNNYNLARDVGFLNISVDLMFGIPFQSLKDWDNSLHDIVKLNPEHISTYSLTIEKNTVFGKWYNEGKIDYVDDELDRKMYHYAIDYLGEHNYNQYEISNFAKEGMDSKHNKVYWELGYYIGLGAGAHSYFDEKRYNNVLDVCEYIKLINSNESIIENEEDISRERKISDYMILGLRLLSGVNKDRFRKVFNTDVDVLFKTKLNKLEKLGLVETNEKNIRLTKKGLDLANQVFVEFLDK